MFLTGYIAGVHFVHTLSDIMAGEVAPQIVSVGRASDGVLDVCEHNDIEEAFDHVVLSLFPYSVVATVEGDLHRWYVCRPDVPDDMVATVELRAVVGPGGVTTAQPTVTEPDDALNAFDSDVFFDGFAAGIDAEDHPFPISMGTLDVMAGLLAVASPATKEMR
ncbi:MAG TPA: hypothetical protein VK427_10035 [Kofleriaceae bacterium]|nr:hypothetical protein [Kofleriaceae bacterium]